MKRSQTGEIMFKILKIILSIFIFLLGVYGLIILPYEIGDRMAEETVITPEGLLGRWVVGWAIYLGLFWCIFIIQKIYDKLGEM